MSSYHQKKALITEPYPCPECGELSMRHTVENCVLADETKVNRLRHLKCSSCGARFFDDEAIHIIQSTRASKAVLTK